MMTEMEVNNYIAAAEEALWSTPEYRHLFNCLVDYRKSNAEGNDESAGIEVILSFMWNMKIGYIIEHLDEIRASSCQESGSTAQTPECTEADG